MRATRPTNHVIPIEKGRALKEKREREFFEPHQTPAIRRLMQCVELLTEVSNDIARKPRGDKL